jgi:hypothetical protein
MPPDATPADQANAFAGLLDALGIGDIDIVALSAGTCRVQELRSGSRGPAVLVNKTAEDVPSIDPPSFRVPSR